MPIDATTQARLDELDGQGLTPLLVARCDPGEIVGIIGVADTLRTDAHAALHALHHVGIKRTVLLTGDRRTIADAIGSHLGVDVVQAEMLPVDKAEAIRHRQRDGEQVAMVGDGINDAPALAVADVGLAIGGPGRDITADAADIVLMGEPLRPLALTVATSRRTVQIIHQNITVFAIGLNTVAIGLAAFGVLPPMQAAVAHEIGSLAVLLNALRLLGFRRTRELRIVRAGRAVGQALHRWSHRGEHRLQDAVHWLGHHRRRLIAWGLPIVVLAGWASSALHVVRVDEVGVVQRFGRVVGEPCGPGWHLRWPWPVEVVRRVRPDAVRVALLGAPRQAAPTDDAYAVEWETVHPGQAAAGGSATVMMTGDIWHEDPTEPGPGRRVSEPSGNGAQTASKLVEISAAVHWVVDDAAQFTLNVRDPERFVEAAAESVLREQVASRRLQRILTEDRGALAVACRDALTARLRRYGAGINVLDVALLDVHPDPGRARLSVIDAYRDVARAQAQQKETVYAADAEAHRLLADAHGRRADALATAESQRSMRVATTKGQAARFVDRQQAFRAYPELARWRLFLTTAGEKLGQRRKVIVDGGLVGRQHVWLGRTGAPLALTPYVGEVAAPVAEARDPEER